MASSYFTDLLKIDVKYTGERNTAANVFFLHSISAAGATVSNLAALASTIYSLWATDIMPYVTSAVTLSEVIAADWTSMDGLVGAHQDTTAGSLTGDPLPSQVCTLVNATTNLRYRGGRGRMYLPQPTGAQLASDMTWTSTFQGDITAGMELVLAGINDTVFGSTDLEFVLYHRGTAKVVQGVEPVLEWQCAAIPGTQRRRIRRVGHKA